MVIPRPSIRASDPLQQTLVRVASVRSTLPKLEELHIKYVVNFEGVKVCEDNIMEGRTTLKVLKVVNITGDSERVCAAYLTAAMKRPIDKGQPASSRDRTVGIHQLPSCTKINRCNASSIP